LINSAKTKVYASYYGAPLSQNIPIRAFSNDIQDIDVQRSVIDGASGALANYEKYFKSSGDRYCFAYKFLKDDTNQAITGKSAGFAFCLKFALKLYKNALNKELAFSIAATGIIDIDEDTTHIEPVNKINNKCKAALECLKSGDLFFYSQKNEDQIDQQLKKKIIDKGISIHAVENVSQAINILFEGHIEKSADDKITSTTKIKRMLVASSFIIFCLCVYLIYFETTISCYDEALTYLESGEYVLAKEISEDCLQNAGNDSIQILLAQINSELILSSNFIYIKNNVSNTSVTDNNSPLLLGMEDGYRFEIQSPQDCFLYILQFDSETKIERLFPLSSFILNQHYLLKNKFTQIPGGENMFYLNDRNHHGPVTIFIIASPWRLKDIENIYNQYEDNESRQIKRNLYNELINRIKHYTEIKNSNIKSLFLKVLSFIQK
jgi:hypothetical protein